MHRHFILCEIGVRDDKNMREWENSRRGPQWWGLVMGEKEKAILVEEICAKAERLKLGEVWHHHPLKGTESEHKPSVGSGFKSLPLQLCKSGVAISHMQT